MMHFKHRKRSGFVLIMVLGIVLIASMIVLAFTEEVLEEIEYAAQFHEREDIRAEAYSYFEVVMAVLNEIRELDDGAIYGDRQVPQGWNNPLAYAGIEPPSEVDVSVQITDETGKFSLAKLIEGADSSDDGADPLSAIFEAFGVDLVESDELIGYLRDWVDEDDLDAPTGGAEADYYERLDLDYEPPNGPIESWSEFKLIRGFDEHFFDPETGQPNQLFRDFRSVVSIYHNSEVNENTANPLVQSLLYELDFIDRTNAQDYLAGLDRVLGTDDDRIFTEVDEGLLPSGANIQAQVLNVRVSVSIGSATFVIEAIVGTGQSSQDDGGIRSDPGGDNALAAQEQQRAESGRDELDVNRENLTEVRENESDTPSYPFQIIRLYENYLM